MELDFIRQRITELRLKKGVSEYKMSLDLGHSRSYIQHIVCGRSLPSIQELLYICDYCLVRFWARKLILKFVHKMNVTDIVQTKTV